METIEAKVPSTQAVRGALVKANIRVQQYEWNSSNHATVTGSKHFGKVSVNWYAGNKPIPGDNEIKLCQLQKILKDAGLNAVLTSGNGGFEQFALNVYAPDVTPENAVDVSTVRTAIKDRRVEELQKRIEANTIEMNKAQEPFLKEHDRLQKLLVAIGGE